MMLILIQFNKKGYNMILQDRVNQLLAKQARKNEGYKIFVNGEQVKVDTPLKSEDEVFASIEMLLADEAVRPSIRVEDPDGKVIMNQDTARVESDNYDSDDDEDDCYDETQQKGVMDIILEALIDEDVNYDSVGSGYDSQLHKNFVIVYLK